MCARFFFLSQDENCFDEHDVHKQICMSALGYCVAQGLIKRQHSAYVPKCVLLIFDLYAKLVRKREEQQEIDKAKQKSAARINSLLQASMFIVWYFGDIFFFSLFNKQRCSEFKSNHRRISSMWIFHAVVCMRLFICSIGIWYNGMSVREENSEFNRCSFVVISVLQSAKSICVDSVIHMPTLSMHISF